MNPELKLINNLIQNKDFKSWEHTSEPMRADILDMKYPTPERHFGDHLGDEFEGIPTYQIPIILEAILDNPNPTIISAMKDALVMAKMVYTDGELDEIDQEAGYFNNTKRHEQELYERDLKLYQKYAKDVNPSETEIKQTFKKIIDAIYSYEEDHEYSIDRHAIVCELLSAIEDRALFDVEGSSYVTELRRLKTYDLALFLELDDQILWKIMESIKSKSQKVTFSSAMQILNMIRKGQDR